MVDVVRKFFVTTSAVDVPRRAAIATAVVVFVGSIVGQQQLLGVVFSPLIPVRELALIRSRCIACSSGG